MINTAENNLASMWDRAFKDKYPQAYGFFIGTLYDRNFTVEEASAEKLDKFSHIIPDSLAELRLLAEKKDIPWQAVREASNSTIERVPNQDAAWKMLDTIIDILRGEMKLSVYRETFPKYKPRMRTSEEEAFEKRHPSAYGFFMKFVCRHCGTMTVEKSISRSGYGNAWMKAKECLPDLKDLLEKKDIPWEALRIVSNSTGQQIPDADSAWKMLHNIIDVLNRFES